MYEFFQQLLLILVVFVQSDVRPLDLYGKEPRNSSLTIPLSTAILIPRMQGSSLVFRRVVANPVELPSATAYAHALHLLHCETKLDVTKFATDAATVVEFCDRAEQIAADEIRADVREQLGLPDMAKLSADDQSLSIAERWNQIAASIQKHMPESDHQQIAAAFQYGLAVNQGLEAWLQSSVTRKMLGLDGDSLRDALGRLQKGKHASAEKMTKAQEDSRTTILNELSAEQREWFESVTTVEPPNFDVFRCQLATSAGFSQDSQAQLQHRFGVLGGIQSNSFGILKIYDGTPFDLTVKVCNWISILDSRSIREGSREDLLKEIRSIEDEYLKKTTDAVDLALAMDRPDLLRGVRFTDAFQISNEMHRKKVWDAVSNRVDPLILESFQAQTQHNELLIFGLPGVLASNRLPDTLSLSPEQLKQVRARIIAEADRVEKLARELQVELLESVARGFDPDQNQTWDIVFSDGIIRRNPMPHFLIE